MLKQKPNLVQLLNYHRVTMPHLARIVGIRPAEVYAMALGVAVDRRLAERVLAAFYPLVGIRYTVDLVQVNVRESNEHYHTTSSANHLQSASYVPGNQYRNPTHSHSAPTIPSLP